MKNFKVFCCVGLFMFIFQAQAQESTVIAQSNSLLSSGKAKEAFAMLKQEATKGTSKDIVYQLGLFYQQGIGTAQNDSMANVYLLKAANLNHVEAQKMMAFRYQEGIGCPSNKSKAFSLFQKCAEYNDDCVINLINCYNEGLGVTKNIKMAVTLAQDFVIKNKGKQRAELAEVCYLIATKYYEGDGSNFKKDFGQALKWVIITNEYKNNSSISTYVLKSNFQNCKKQLSTEQYNLVVKEASEFLGAKQLDYKNLQ